MVFGANHVRTKTNSSASVLHTAGSSVIFPGIPKHVGPLWEWYGGPTYGKGVPFVGDPHGNFRWDVDLVDGDTAWICTSWTCRRAVVASFVWFRCWFPWTKEMGIRFQSPKLKCFKNKINHVWTHETTLDQFWQKKNSFWPQTSPISQLLRDQFLKPQTSMASKPSSRAQKRRAFCWRRCRSCAMSCFCSSASKKHDYPPGN